MELFVVNQNPKSIYDDIKGKRYDYSRSLPNGQQIKKGDILIFNMAKKIALKYGYGNCNLFAIAKVKEVVAYERNNKKMAYTTYDWYKKLKKVMTFEEMGGDPRTNMRNSINKVNHDRKLEVITSILEYL